MTTIYRSASLAAVSFVLGAAVATAQNNNPGDTGGSPGSRIALPTYPAGQSDPALSPGRLTKGATGVPADANPNVRGATGEGVVQGDNSSVSGDRKGTTQQKTGQISGGSGN